MRVLDKRVISGTCVLYLYSNLTFDTSQVKTHRLGLLLSLKEKKNAIEFSEYNPMEDGLSHLLMAFVLSLDGV